MSPRTQEKVLTTAAELFHAHSYASVGMDMICKEAGVHKGSVYHFFPSKEAIALAVIDHSWSMAKEYFYEPVFSANEKGLVRFSALFDLFEAMSKQNIAEGKPFCGCPIGNLASEQSTQNEFIRQKIADVFRETSEYYQRAFEEAIELGEIPAEHDPAALSRLMLNLMQGSVLLAKVQNAPERIRPVIDLFLEQLRCSPVLVEGSLN